MQGASTTWSAAANSRRTRYPGIHQTHPYTKRHYRKLAEGIPALYDLVLLLEFGQRCVSGLVIAIPGIANTAFCMVDAPAVITKISDEGFVTSQEAPDSVLTNWPCA